MNWSTLLAALVGGLIGAGVPAIMTGLGWRREAMRHREARRWEDAQVMGEVRQFLEEVYPSRRAVGRKADLDAEKAQWAPIRQRADDLERRLLVIAAGHPSEAVQSLARYLAFDMIFVTSKVTVYIRDLIQGRADDVVKAEAYEAHKNAVKCADDLERAAKKAAVSGF